MSEIVSDEGPKARGRRWKGGEPPKKEAPKASTKAPSTWTERFPVKLTREEIAKKGDVAAQLDAEVEALEADKKSAVASFKGQIDAKRSELRTVMRSIRTGEEERPVEVFEEYDYRVNTCFVKRRDSGTIVRQRPLSLEERQEDLFGSAKKPGPQATLGEAIAAKRDRDAKANGKARANGKKKRDERPTEITEPGVLLAGAAPDERASTARRARRGGRK